MDKRILETFLLFILLDSLPNVISGGRFCNNPSPPVCADDCDGNGYYISPDGTACIQCPQCSAGQELNKDCGNGLNGDAVCIPCPEGFFSLSTSKRCTQCTTCTNTVEQEPCQLTQNRVCGDCLPGFVRGSDRFSTDFNACPNRCSDLPRDTPQCRDWWSNQKRESIEVDQPPEIAPVEKPFEEVSLDDVDPCEPEPPLCIDPCHDGNFFLDYDGLCKACLSCQPGEELNKVCGRGKNGDAYCRRCPEGTFSEDGVERCSPCRICVNTVATECTASRNTECGECLPGYYQDADGYFPDQGACPNKCPECPNTVPQCQEWCDSRTNPDKVTVVSAESVRQDDVTLSDVVDDGINVEAKLPLASHGSYMHILIVLASLLAVVIIVFITVLFVFRCLWKRSNESNASTTPILPNSSATTSPTNSPSIPRTTVYEPTTIQYSPEGYGSEFWNFIRGSTDAENDSSAVSTPSSSLNRQLRQMLEKQVGVAHDAFPRLTTPQPLIHHGSVKEERMVSSVGSMNQLVPARQNDRDFKDRSRPCSLSSGKVVTETPSGTVHQHVEGEDKAPRGMLLRRRSSGNIENSVKKFQNRPEDEAALHPTDSSRDDGPTTNVPEDTNKYKSAYPKQPGRSLKPNNLSLTTLPDLPEESPVENSTQKKPAVNSDDARSTGNKSPGDTNVNIHITMTTKDVETVHLGDVHNKSNCRGCAHQGINASEPHNDDDDDEAQKLLNEGNKLTRGRSGNSDDDDDGDHDDSEGDKLLDHKSSYV